LEPEQALRRVQASMGERLALAPACERQVPGPVRLPPEPRQQVRRLPAPNPLARLASAPESPAPRSRIQAPAQPAQMEHCR
jgi:hypothetical protein